jgi:CRP-like cAMP-binding protein
VAASLVRSTRDAKVEALKGVTLFEGLSKKELIEIAHVTEDMEIEAGSVLCTEGGLGREFFVIVDGTAEVTRGGRHLATRGRVNAPVEHERARRLQGREVHGSASQR